MDIIGVDEDDTFSFFDLGSVGKRVMGGPFQGVRAKAFA